MIGDVFGQNTGIIYSGGILNKVLDEINVELSNIILVLLGISRLIFATDHVKLLSVWPFSKISVFVTY